jgi:hypothetical protein
MKADQLKIGFSEFRKQDDIGEYQRKSKSPVTMDGSRRFESQAKMARIEVGITLYDLQHPHNTLGSDKPKSSTNQSQERGNLIYLLTTNGR